MFLVRHNTYSLRVRFFVLLKNSAFRDSDGIKPKSTLILSIILFIRLWNTSCRPFLRVTDHKVFLNGVP
jgi:hypothetical protein